MTDLFGEYECTLDPKGRILLPVGLKKQMPPESQDRFIITRGFESCLYLYPYSEWLPIRKKINELSKFNPKNREFKRYFLRGASELGLDNSNRLLFPKSLLDYAGITRDIVLFANGDVVEVWDKEKYDNLLTIEPEDFSKLAAEVMDKTESD